MWKIFWEWITGPWCPNIEKLDVSQPEEQSPPIPIITQPKPIFTPMPVETNPDSITYPWDSPQHNYHNARVICDNLGLTVNEKNLICACIYQESQFMNFHPDGTPVKHENLNKNGTLSTTDWGIVQINDWFHIAPNGSPFASVAAVLARPEDCVTYMVKQYLAGRLSMWDSYLSGAYRQWLVPTSPMWDLAS